MQVCSMKEHENDPESFLELIFVFFASLLWKYPTLDFLPSTLLEVSCPLFPVHYNVIVL
jgi:hypothetical protein